ncbi:MAG: hypothetical protein AABZ57_00955 [Candidatus Margulisiibacteriota bacterium]
MNKKKTNPTDTFTASQVGVMLEDLNTKFDILAEGQSIMRADIHSLKDGQVGIVNRLDRVEMKTDIMYKELSGQRAEINSQGVALRGQTADIKEIKNILISHDKRLANLEPTRA